MNETPEQPYGRCKYNADDQCRRSAPRNHVRHKRRFAQTRAGEFTGPLDLLLYLIRRNRWIIYDIPVARITDEYLRYLQLMQELDIAVAGDF